MTKSKQPGFFQEKDGSNLTIVLAVLVVIAVLGAKYFGFVPPFVRQASEKRQQSSGTPVVLVYAAYMTGNYSPAPPHAQGVGDVASVCHQLASSLEKMGLEAQRLSGQESVAWSLAYGAARSALLPAMEGTNVAAIVDIHRDALEGRPVGYNTTEAGGESLAKILFVVGDVDNPYVEENLQFAEKVRLALESRAAGITRGIKIVHENVNGDLHPQSLQVHVGEYYDNTLTEALASVELLAAAIKSVL